MSKVDEIRSGDVIVQWCAIGAIILLIGLIVLISAYEPDEPIKTESIAVIETLTPEPTPTPTPEPTLSADQYREMYGGLKQGQWLSYQRDKADMNKSLSVHMTVYDWRQFGVIDWYSVSWGQYFKSGAGEGNKFLFVFVSSYSDDGSARTWGIQPSQFYLDINGKIYERTTELLPEIRIKNFDEIYDYRHVETIQPYGYARGYNSERLPIAWEIGFLKCGESNMWSGYIPFAVPADTKIEDVRVHINTHNLVGPHWWQLE